MSHRPVILVIENEEGAGPAQLEASATAAGLELDVRSAAGGTDAIPERLSDAAGLVVLGASYDVADAPERPHLFRVMDLFREADATGRPALGICLGGQLASEALGGEVTKAPQPEIGWVLVRPTEEGREDPVARSLGDGRPLFQWHHDVFTTPPGAVQVLTSNEYPSQGFRLGTVWGVQSHPEADPEILAEWCSLPEARAELEAANVDPGRLIEEAREFSPGAKLLLDAWCALAVKKTVPGER
jgi:GMP synthase (glutamine-hydrolysing)